MKVNMKGLINQLDSLRERINDLFDNLDNLEELEQEDIEIETVQQYFQNDDTFNLSIALDILEQVEKLDKALEIIKDKRVDVCFFMNCRTLEEYNDDVLASYAYEEDAAERRMLTQEEYDFLKEVLK